MATERSNIQSGMLAIAVLPCCYPSLTPPDRLKAEQLIASARPTFEQWATKLDEEIACRASDQCVGDWVCLAVLDRRDATKEMARERANPSGVVDLRRLHELGERIQADEEEIARRKGWYEQWRRKPFREGVCR